MTAIDRRALLGGGTLTAAGAAAFHGLAGEQASALREPEAPLAGPSLSVADRAALRRTDPAVGQVVFLSERGREGFFLCTAGETPRTDPREGLFVAGRGNVHFARLWDGTHGRPEWFGATVNDGAADCADAIEACYALCPVTQLSQADYFIRRTLRFAASWRTVRGVGNFANDEGRGTRIILQGSAPGVHRDDVMVVGSAKQPSANSEDYPYENHFANFTLIRDGAATPHPSGDLRRYPTGLRAAFLVRCTFREITSLASSVGFYIGGVVYTKFDDCLAQRLEPGTTARGDRSVGYYLDGNIRFGFAGGNASLYVRRCVAVGQHPQHVEPAGLIARGAFVDTFLDDFESARIDTGVSFAVDGATGVGQTVDLHIRNAVLDGCGRYGIDIDLGTTSSASIDIIDPYIYAAGSGGQRGIAIHGGAGLATLTGGQVHGAFAGGSLYFSRTRGIRVQGVKIHQSSNPVVIDEASGLHLEPQINNVGKASGSFAVAARALRRSVVRPLVIGTGGPSFAGGIDLDRTCMHNAIDGSAIDPGCFASANAADKVRFDGADAAGANAAAFLAAGNVLIGVRG